MKNILNTNTFKLLCESNQYVRKGNADAFLAKKYIVMCNGKIMKTSKIVSAVNKALLMFEKNRPYEYEYIRNSAAIYVTDNEMTNSMCVDSKGDLYINAEFVYSNLKMNVNALFFVLYHEAMHNIMEHIRRTYDYNAKHRYNKLTWHQMNVCADYEVNTTMIVDKIVPEQTVANCNGYYDLKNCVGKTFEEIALLANSHKIDMREKELTWDPDDYVGNGQESDFKIGNDAKPKVTDERGKYKKESEAYQRGYEKAVEIIKKIYDKNNNDLALSAKDLIDLYNNSSLAINNIK